MKKLWQKLALLGTLLCVTLSFGILAACGEPEGGTPNPPDGGDKDTDITYTVYVKLPDGSPLTDENTYVQWCTQTGMCYTPVALDASGKASDKLEPGVYDVHVLLSAALEEQYTYDEDAYKTTAAGGDITITLSNKAPTPPQFDEPTKGTGTKDSPYYVSAGRYCASLTESAKTAYFAFAAEEAGVYTLSTDGEIEAVFGGEALKSGEFTVDALQINKRIEFTVTLQEGATYPAEVPVVFARKGNITVKPEREENVQANEYSLYIDAIETELNKVGFEATVVPDNGFYRLGTKDGAYVLVQIKNAVSPLTKALNALNDEDYIFETDEHPDDVSYPVITKNYNLMINGDPTNNITGYTHVLNSDGVCMLTEELAQFLKLYAEANAEAIKGSSDIPADALWQFALFTYAPATEIDVDKLYNEDTGNPTGDPIMLTANVPAGGKVFYSVATRWDGTFTVASDNTNAKAIYAGSGYAENGFEFTLTTGRGTTIFAITTADNTAAEITFSVSDASSGSSEGDGTMLYPYIAEVGTFTVTGTEAHLWEGVFYTFTPTVSGTYKISSTNANAWITSPNGLFDSMGEGAGFELTIELDAGEIYELAFNHQSMTNKDPFTFNVTIELITA